MTTADRTRRGSATDRAHDVLRRRILGGDLPPGTMLSELELAAELGSSRTPVRTALARLQEEGLVRIYPQRGAQVRALSETEVREAAEVRHALELAGIRRAGAPERASLRDRLADSLRDQEQALRDDDHARFADLAAAFHRSFVELAGNATMLDLYDRLHDRQLLSILRAAAPIAEDPAAVLAEHRRLLDHAAHGDWQAFADHLDEHQRRHHRLDVGGAPA